jgi:hypothetical protein
MSSPVRAKRLRTGKGKRTPASMNATLASDTTIYDSEVSVIRDAEVKNAISELLKAKNEGTGDDPALTSRYTSAIMRRKKNRR